MVQKHGNQKFLFLRKRPYYCIGKRLISNLFSVLLAHQKPTYPFKLNSTFSIFRLSDQSHCVKLQDFCMYDILQLNDMLVPELLDIAEQLNIPNVKKLDKQGLVYKILDSQAVTGSKGAA